MLRSLNDLVKYAVSTSDGVIGEVEDFFFDDRIWALQYLVVDTGKWLPGRKVLVTSVLIDRVHWDSRQVDVKLTRKDIEASPGVEADKPVSQQEQSKEGQDFYVWAEKWSVEDMLRLPIHERVSTMEATFTKPPGHPAAGGADPHLRSAKEVSGYHIHASDGEIGHVDDFIVDDEHWIIRYVVVDTRNWLPGKKVLVSPDWVQAVSWEEGRVEVDLPREQIKNSPQYDPLQPINREYEVQLYDYYGRPKYWV